MCLEISEQSCGLPLLVQFKRQQHHRDIGNNGVFLPLYINFDGRCKKKGQIIKTPNLIVYCENLKYLKA
jgi:hypothetical protein